MASIDVKCAQCSKIFPMRRAEWNRQWRKGRTSFFCGLSCAATHANASKIAPVLRKLCAFCGNEFITKGDRHEAEFCSRSCASKGSVTDFRRQRASESGTANAPNLIKTEGVLAIRENWKYAEIREYLTRIGLKFQFEYRIEDHVFDLALLDRMLLVEFDGPEHRQGKRVERDLTKDAEAAKFGWRVVRIPVAAKTLVRPSVIYPVLDAQI